MAAHGREATLRRVTVLAYLDAGSASAIVSLILGGVAAVGVAVKYRWRKLLELLRIKKPLDDD